MVRITKRFEFAAAHRLPNVSVEHKCFKMHGHNFAVEITCEGDLDDRGFVVDYAEIAAAWQPLHKLLDHQTLNDVDGLDNPTSEHLALWVLEHLQLKGLPLLVSVKVFESARDWCEVGKL